MKRLTYLILIVAVELLMITFATIKPVSALVDFDAYLGTTIPDGSIDGTIGTEWDDAGNYTGVAIDPVGTAEIWTKHDGDNLYIAIQFTADSNDSWVGIQFGGIDCMDVGKDLALFGHSNYADDGYKDTYFTSGYGVSNDTVQNGVGAITATGNVTTIELKKPLDSGDSAGNDIAWSVGSTYKLIIDWDSNGGGSSGGSTNHRDAGPIANNIFINPNVIPEFSGLMFIAVLIVIAIPVIVLVRKTVLKPTTTIKL